MTRKFNLLDVLLKKMKDYDPINADKSKLNETSMQPLIETNETLSMNNINSINKNDNKSNNNNYSRLSYYNAWFQFFILGTFNNFAYVVILAAAKSLADCFNESNLIGVEQWSLTVIGFFLKC